MGESEEQRIEMAVLLHEIGSNSIPINILQPIKGTPLENATSLSDEEILTSFAMFRILNPEAEIRFAGGRSSIKHIEEQALKCGVDASLVGDMLTTVGSKVAEDFALFERLGYEL
jgi:biotin synthase-like enzyme